MSDAATDRGNESAAAMEQEALRRPSKRDVRALVKLIPYVLTYKAQMAAALIMLAIAAGATLAIPVAVRQMIDLGFSAESAASIDRYFLMILVVAAVLAVSSAARFFFVSWLGERVVADLRTAVYRHVTGLSPAFFEVTRTGEVLSRLTTDTTLIQTVVGSSVSIALRNGVTLIGCLIMLVITSPGLSGLVFLAAPVVIGIMLVFGRAVRALSRQSQDRVADTSATAAESLSAIQTVQAFTHEDYDRARFRDSVEEAFRVAVRRITMRSALTVVLILLLFSYIVGVLWVGAQAVIDGTMTGGQLSQFVLYAVLLAGSFGALGEVWGDMQRAAGATERLMELLSVEPEIKAPPAPLTMPSPAKGTIAFRDVTFHYPTRPKDKALDGFSMAVNPGETVALVGPSGAGKSTVFQLIQRFYDVQSGAVLVDDCPVDEVDPTELRARLGIVSQDPVVFGADALTNIRYGRPEASDAEVIAAAKDAAAHEFLERLPDGYATPLGERGVTLSGGQRQRIAIARAILRDPPILLLDEATSALDAESELLVQTALERVMAGRTTLVIAHRLATVLKADRIVVMDQGRVVAEGSHDTLVAQGGLYARLAQLQFGRVSLNDRDEASPPETATGTS